MNFIKDYIRIIKNIFRKLLINIPYIERPLPRNPFIYNRKISKEQYINLNNEALKINNKKLLKFENKNGFRVNRRWFKKLTLVTQTCIKKSSLNFNHGRILYSCLSKYLSELRTESPITILETGTARGFSSVCMAKSLIDMKKKGMIITLDCVGHNQEMYWNCISDIDGKKTRAKLLAPWEKELQHILFIQGWTDITLKRLGINRINFAFLDAQHTKEAVMEEFIFVSSRQLKGDVIIFDDVTPLLFNGVCEAITEIENSFPYDVEKLFFDKMRGYAIAKKY